MKSLVLLLIRVYQIIISPLLGPSCRFEPSCSAYCMDAVRQKGVWKGMKLGFRRILKCHPFHQGGYDPVQ